MVRATTQEIQAFTDTYSSWRVEDGKLHCEYKFSDFVQAFGFMTEAALVAERANHHPEWFNVYNKVIVDLTTHEAGGITQKDFDLAKKMQEIATSRFDF